MGGGSVPGDIPGDVSGLRDAIRAWGRKPWRVVFVDGDVAPPPADRRQLRIDASAKSIVDDVRRLLEDRREWYAEEIAEGVRRAGGCDAFVCSGKCDSAVAAALARVAGFASRYVPSGENRSSRRRDSRGFIRRWIRPSSRRVTSRRARPGVARDRCVSRRARTRGGTRTRGWTPRGGDATGSRRTSPGRCFARRDGERMVIGETTSRRATVTRATMIAYRRRRIVPR